MRNDLLSLTPDDLQTLSNRGIVKRAIRDVEKGELTAEVEEKAGTLVMRWSDGVVCTFAAGQPLADAHCDCPKIGMCRHLIRSVLAYQKTAPASDPTAPSTPTEPWNPGDIEDGLLAPHFAKGRLTRLKTEFKQGHVFELVRGVHPVATIQTVGVTVRFLVAGDPQYAHCTCADQMPCKHVPLAIWAFRDLATDQTSGLIDSNPSPGLVPEIELGSIDRHLRDLLELGMAGAPSDMLAQWQRLAQRVHQAGLIWPSTLLAEIAGLYEQYQRLDARFDSAELVTKIGELLIRTTSIRNGTPNVPDLYVRGSERDAATKFAKARLTGLGTQAVIRSDGVRLISYLHDDDSGRVVALTRTYEDEPNADPAPVARLAQRRLAARLPANEIGLKRLIVPGGTRLANNRLRLGNTKVGVSAQDFDWNTLRAPLLADDFNEIRARLALLPPKSLRPRHVGSDLVVVPIQTVSDARFDVAAQTVFAHLTDANGDGAVLTHPYFSRGAEGLENLQVWLRDGAAQPLFVCAQVQLSSVGLLLRPVGLVFEKGGKRHLVQPWVDANKQPSARMGQRLASAAPSTRTPQQAYPADLQQALGHLWLNGLRRADATTARRWRGLAQQGAAFGFQDLAQRVKFVADELENKQSVVRWDWLVSAERIIELTTLIQFANDLG